MNRVAAVSIALLLLASAGLCQSAPPMGLRLATVSGVAERCVPSSVAFAVTVQPDSERCRIASVRFLRAGVTGGGFAVVGTACAPDPFSWRSWETEEGCPVYRAEALDASGCTIAVSNDVTLKIVSCACAQSCNGIAVMQPKIYDQRSLESMLDAARKAYSTVSFPDQSALLAKTGTIQGITAESTSQSYAVQAGKSDKPQTASASPPEAMIKYEPTLGIATSDLLSEQQQLYYQFANYSLLAESSLTDRVLAQTGVDCNERVYFTPRAGPVIGFSISIEQPPMYADAVADVDVTICPGTPELAEGEGPFVVNLIPQAKTYNVASIRRDASSIGFGAVVSVFQISAAGNRQSESVYLVKDTDTVAFERLPYRNSGERAKGAHFAWQFRPVLGQRMLDAARRDVYAVIGLPVDTFKPWLAKVFVITSWHRIVKDGRAWKGVDPNPIPGSVNEQRPTLLYLPSSYIVQKGMRHVENVLWEDAGEGKIAIALLGKFDLNVSASVGGRKIDAPDYVASSTGRIKFTASALEVMRNDPMLLDRFGVATNIRVPQRHVTEGEGLAIVGEPCVQPLDATTSLVTVTIANKLAGKPIAGPALAPTHGTGGRAIPPEPGPSDVITNPGRLWSADESGVGSAWSELGQPPNHRPLFMIDCAVYGLCNSPVTRKPNRDGSVTFSMRVPTDSIRRSPELLVKDLLWGSSFVASAPLVIRPDFTVTVLKDIDTAAKKEMTIAITGTNLDPPGIEAYRVFLGDCEVTKREPGCPSPAPPAYIATNLSNKCQIVLTADKSALEGVKYIVLSRGEGSAPVFVPLPGTAVPGGK